MKTNTYFAVALVASGVEATKIIYREDVSASQYRVNPSLYPMVFNWPVDEP